jgi:hypothetical protein
MLLDGADLREPTAIPFAQVAAPGIGLNTSAITPIGSALMAEFTMTADIWGSHGYPTWVAPKRWSQRYSSCGDVEIAGGDREKTTHRTIGA